LSKHGFAKARAFTLIELLVVVAIIALLISILLPSLARAKKQAKQTKCAAQLHDIGSSLTSYSVEYGRFPHQNAVGPEGTPQGGRTAVALWGYSVHQTIADYMGGLRESLETRQLSKTHEVFYCPFLEENEIEFSDVISGPGTGIGIETTEERYLHIAYTYFGRLDEVANDPAKPRSWETEETVPDKRRHYAGKLPNSDDVLMTDTISLWGGGQKWRINHGVGWDEPFDFGSMNTVPKIEGANEVFADGHAVWREPEHFKELIKAPSFVHYKRNATLDAGVDSYWW
jgi:prepilin-type N-terminal cleavage/methylation domain-containing protein